MRRSRSLGVLGVVMLGLAAAGCTGGSGDGKPTASSTSGAPATTGAVPVTGVSAPDGGGLRVVEQGLSQITDRGQAMVSFGVIMQSTSTDWVATFAQLTVTFTDASGKRVEDGLGGRYRVVAAFPHQRTAVAGQVYVDVPAATRIQAVVGSVTWVPRTAPVLVQLVAADVRTRRALVDTTFWFGVTSSGSEGRRVDGRYINVIFRDRSGRLIGGTGWIGGTPHCGSVPPGVSTCSLSTVAPLPAGTVDARTEVYVNGV